MKRTVLLVMIGLALVALLGTQAGCCTLFSAGGPNTDAGQASQDPSLEEFLVADAKTGDFDLHTVRTDATIDQTGEFWVDGRKFRYDLYEGDALVRSIQSPDGVTAYFVQHNDELCEPSVASVDFYLREYSKPPVDSLEDGTDEETGATRVKYVVQKTEDLEGSANPWYQEDITYLVKKGIVIGVITRGAVPEDDGSIGDLDVSRRMFSNVRINVDIPADTFVLPYPIKEAE
ncbi:MAG: hypothetical protein ACYC77_04195 [Coriobacteriia bacterium]